MADAVVMTAPTDLAGKLTMLGLGSPANRALVGGAAAAVAVMAVRPRALFRENGEYRPFKLSSPDPDGIYCHAAFIPLVVAWTAATFL